MSLGQSAAQNGAAAEESASVMRRPVITSRAPARRTRSRKRCRLQPVAVASAIARAATCMTAMTMIVMTTTAMATTDQPPL